MNQVLTVEGLSFQYGETCIWSDVAFALEPGEIAYLTGPNGSGKSTLFRCLAGWSPVRSGDILLNGQPFRGRDRQQRSQIAFVPDVPVFYDDLTAEEHVRFMLGANRRQSCDKYAGHLFEVFELDAFRKQLPSSFSRGMREKLSLLIALTLQPRLLLLDEPYGPLDEQSSLVLSHEIKTVTRTGTAVLLSCHHPIPQLEPDKVLRFEKQRLIVEAAHDA